MKEKGNGYYRWFCRVLFISIGYCDIWTCRVVGMSIRFKVGRLGLRFNFILICGVFVSVCACVLCVFYWFSCLSFFDFLLLFVKYGSNYLVGGFIGRWKIRRELVYKRFCKLWIVFLIYGDMIIYFI